MSKQFGRFTWKGFRWGRTTIPKTFENDINFGPGFYDPDFGGIDESYFETGVDGRLDLRYEDFIERVSGDVKEWHPRVNHGWYFWGRFPHYLYSDGGTVDYFSTGDTDNTIPANWITLSYVPKPGVPILGRQYERMSTGNLKVYRELDKVAYFNGIYVAEEEQDTFDEDTNTITWANVDPTGYEMMFLYNVDPTNSGVVVVSGVLNNDYIFDVGQSPLNSGSYANLQVIGVSDGTANQAWNLPYTPVESGTCHAYVFNSGIVPFSPATEFEVVDSWSAIGSGEQKFVLDKDLGVLYGGDGVCSGIVPSGSFDIGVYYRCTVGVEYEKQNTTDLTTAWETTLEMLKKGSYRNFLILAEGQSDPFEIILTADLPTMSPTYGPLNVGNKFGRLRAEVLDTNATPIEGSEVTFFFNGDRAGARLNSADNATSTSTTNATGYAYTRLLSPATIRDLGEYISVSGVVNSSILTLSTISPSVDYLSDVYTYGVYADDEVLGILDESAAYDDFFDRADIDDRLATEEWEELRRSYWEGLGSVVPFSNGATSGRKKIMATWDNAAVNPHTGGAGAFVPVQPSGLYDTGSGIDLSYSVDLPLTDSGLVGFFVVSPILAHLQASTYNSRRNTTVYSNEIEVYIGVSDEGRGTYYFDTVNALESGVLPINPTSDSGTIPFGWRLPSTSPMFTAASAMDQLTFIDINPLGVLGLGFGVDSGLVP